MKRVAFCSRSGQTGWTNIKNIINTFGPKCWLPCVKVAGIIIHYSCAKDGLIFVILETEVSLTVAQAKMAAIEVNTRWQQFMAPFTDANARPDESFSELEEYFHLD